MTLETIDKVLIISNIIILFSNILITFGFLTVYLNGGQYIPTIIKYRSNIDKNDLEKEYPIVNQITLTEDVNEFFLVRTPGQEMKNVKVLKFTGMRRGFLFFKDKFKYKTIKKFELPVSSEEYLLVQTIEPEGIPPYKIKARVNGEIIELDFGYNGLYGTRDKEHVKVKRDIISLFYYVFSGN